MGKAKQRDLAIQLSEGMRRLDLSGGDGGAAGRGSLGTATATGAAGRDEAVAGLLKPLQLGAGGSSRGGEAAAPSSTLARVRARRSKVKKVSPTKSSSCRGAAADPLAPKSKASKKKKKKTAKGKILGMALNTRRSYVCNSGGDGGATGRGSLRTATATSTATGAADRDEVMAELMKHLQLGSSKGGEAAAPSSLTVAPVKARRSKVKKKVSKSSSCRGAAADPLAPKRKEIKKKKKTAKEKKRRWTDKDILSMALGTQRSYVCNDPTVIAAVIRVREEKIEFYKNHMKTMSGVLASTERNLDELHWTDLTMKKEKAEKFVTRLRSMKERVMRGIQRNTACIEALEDANRRDLDRAVPSPTA